MPRTLWARFIMVLALAIASPAFADPPSPELQGLLNEMVGQWKSDAGERLSGNCDYTTIDIAKQALQRAGFVNMAAGPVVIGALESGCKGIVDLAGGSVITSTYSLAKCIYDHYTTTKDTRSLLICMGVETAGIGAGKLLEMVGVDEITGALDGRVIDALGDYLKDGGLDEITAAAKAGEINAYLKKLGAQLKLAGDVAQKKAQSESPDAIEFRKLAYGCTVQIGMNLRKINPPTRGEAALVLTISVRDCDCDATPPVGQALEYGSAYLTVPVKWGEGVGSKPAWIPDFSRMRTTITSKCCYGQETRTTQGGGPTDGPVGDPKPGPTDKPKPPAPAPQPPTFGELCPECADIPYDIAQDQYRIDIAKESIKRAEDEISRLLSEQNDARREIERLEAILARGAKLISEASSGAQSKRVEITADGLKRTTSTDAAGKKSVKDEPTGVKALDEARAKVLAERKRMERLKKLEAEQRAAIPRFKADIEKYTAELKKDQKRLEECEDKCRRRRLGLPEPPKAPAPGEPVGRLPGGPMPVTPQPPAPVPVPKVDPAPPASPAGASCTPCEPIRQELQKAKDELRELLRLLQENYDRLALAQRRLLEISRTFIDERGNLPLEDRASVEEVTARLRATNAEYRQLDDESQKIRAAIETIFTQLEKLEPRIAALEREFLECLKKCLGLLPRVEITIGGTGNNPLNPTDPLGGRGPTGPQTPPPTPGQPGALALSQGSYSGAEGGVVPITVNRTGGRTGSVSVAYATSSGTAIEGADYTRAAGTLTWADGDNQSKTFAIALIDDGIVEGPETFTVALSGVTGGASIGTPGSATVTLVDKDVTPPPQPAGSLQFISATFGTREGAGFVEILVARVGGSAGVVGVNYNTGPASATAGADYGAVSGNLTWASGDTGLKLFSIAIVDDTLVEGPETFFVNLSNPSGGATLGNPATATVTIDDNDTATPGPCGAQPHAWLPNVGAPYTCSGSCAPTPSPQSLTVNGTTTTVSPVHAGGSALFEGCGSTITSQLGTLTYFGQSNHRVTLTRTSNNAYNANVVSSGGGTCSFTCSRSGP